VAPGEAPFAAGDAEAVRALARLRAACLRCTGLAAELNAAAAELERALEEPLKPPLKTPSKPPEPPASTAAAEHRRQHRTGFPARLDADPELAAFVAARLDHMTYEAVAQAVAEHFPPARRVRRSAIHRWWSKRARPAPDPIRDSPG
jgi:hypothetical protein